MQISIWVHNDIYIYIDLYVDNHIWIYGFLGKKMKWELGFWFVPSFETKNETSIPQKFVEFPYFFGIPVMVASHSTSMLESHWNLFVIRSFYKGNIISYPTFVVFPQW